MQLGTEPSPPADAAFLAFLEQSLRHKEQWRKKKQTTLGSGASGVISSTAGVMESPGGANSTRELDDAAALQRYQPRQQKVTNDCNRF